MFPCTKVQTPRSGPRVGNGVRQAWADLCFFARGAAWHLVDLQGAWKARLAWCEPLAPGSRPVRSARKTARPSYTRRGVKPVFSVWVSPQAEPERRFSGQAVRLGRGPRTHREEGESGEGREGSWCPVGCQAESTWAAADVLRRSFRRHRGAGPSRVSRRAEGAGVYAFLSPSLVQGCF